MRILRKLNISVIGELSVAMEKLKRCRVRSVYYAMRILHLLN